MVVSVKIFLLMMKICFNPLIQTFNNQISIFGNAHLKKIMLNKIMGDVVWLK
jgi:hypothetical protein